MVFRFPFFQITLDFDSLMTDEDLINYLPVHRDRLRLRKYRNYQRLAKKQAISCIVSQIRESFKRKGKGERQGRRFRRRRRNDTAVWEQKCLKRHIKSS